MASTRCLSNQGFAAMGRFTIDASEHELVLRRERDQDPACDLFTPRKGVGAGEPGRLLRDPPGGSGRVSG